MTAKAWDSLCKRICLIFISLWFISVIIFAGTEEINNNSLSYLDDAKIGQISGQVKSVQISNGSYLIVFRDGREKAFIGELTEKINPGQHITVSYFVGFSRVAHIKIQ